MKSLILSRFLVLLPWVLLVILMLDTDGGNRAPRPSSSHLARRPQPAPHQEAPRRREAEQPPQQQQQQLPLIYAITPTYSRPVQKAELTRLANTFRQVAHLHWILVEDSAIGTELVSRFAAGLGRRGGPPCTHLHVLTPRRYKRPGQPRATEQRNAGLAWIRQRHQHLPAPQPGVLFFADDDNTYSLELFEEVTEEGEASFAKDRSPSSKGDPRLQRGSFR
ncbi:galactosylgalactosylxylosylprotein 3-beta-glucuronosyltransferase 2 [Crotalus adamanteus]|uniref:Galactosylgalactosylxylosylprotein 3-beta-glucuronosyltransferase n=1 Tax=Crotalus adamanteus TaxID=8729 RepID=A0AAW1CAL2_CROAD